MNYNFEFAVSAKISAKVVEEMIAKVVMEQTGKKVSKVELQMRSVTKGHQRDEYTETVFDGATVYFENEPALKKIKASDNNGFVADKY